MLKIVMDTAGDLAEGWQEDYQIDLNSYKHHS